jgi:DNA polymerase-3 subunit beta
LSCAFLSVSEKTLTVKTTDLEQSIISKTEIKNEESGSVCVLMSKLSEIVSALPNEEIKINVNEDLLLEINSNQGTYKITGRSSDEFPESPAPQTKETLSIKGKDFSNIIDKTSFATSRDDLKPALSGVYLNINKNTTTAVSTDGHRLVKFIQERKGETEHSLVVPGKFLKIIKSTIKEEEVLRVDIDENTLSTNQKNFTITTRIIKETFPDFNSVIPDNNTIQATLKTEELIACLKRVSIFSNRTTKQTLLDFSEKGIVVSGITLLKSGYVSFITLVSMLRFFCFVDKEFSFMSIDIFFFLFIISLSNTVLRGLFFSRVEVR